MPRLTVSLTEEDAQYIEEQSQDSEEYDSKSAVMRDCIQAHKERDELQTTIERLKNEKQTVLQQRDEHSQLVRYVEHERSYREAPLSTRLKWWVFGRDRAE